MATNQQFSLRWNNYLHHITDAFQTLREDENLVDVTLCCEGGKIKAHKMLLSACSSYFREIFKENPCQHPVIIFRNVKYEDLVALVSFMYKGEVNVEQEGLSSFLDTAELLEVKGLTGGSNKNDECDVEESKTRKPLSPKSDSPLMKKRKSDLKEISLRRDSLPIVKTEPEYFGADSPEELDDTNHSLALANSETNFEAAYEDENIDNSLDTSLAGSSINDSNNQDSLQVLAHGLWRRLHPSLRRFSCDECGKVFKHPRSLDHHKKMHEGRTTCPYCRRVFGRMYALRLHITSTHPGLAEIPPHSSSTKTH